MHHPSYFARIAPDRPAFILAEDNICVTYATLVDRSAQAARLIAYLGIAQGETIAILLENHVRFPEIVWAAKDSGLRYVTISTHLNARDTAYIIQDSGARLLITSAAMRQVATDALGLVDDPPISLMLDGAVSPFISYEDAISAHDSSPLQGRCRGASMLYSSGTTGKPKGVQTALLDVPPTVPPQRFATTVPRYEFDEDSVFLNPAPFYHAGPLRFMMTIHRCGGTVIGFQTFDAARTLRAIEVYGATHGFFVPTMFARMLKLDPSVRASTKLSTMRHAIHAAAPCPVSVKRAMIDWWGPVIDELYSGTEAVGHTFISSQEWLAHPGSVGRAAGCTLKIVDDAGASVPPGIAGRILMSNGLQVAYHGEAAKTDLYDQEGFASLGDIGYVDEDGYLYLTDRESQMIIVGGVNIYPQEAEAALREHHFVDDVAVIGVPHPDLGEEVKAVVQLKVMPDDPAALEAELLEFCRARLSLIKCPRSVEFTMELPRTPMDKLNRQSVKLRFWEGKGAAI